MTRPSERRAIDVVVPERVGVYRGIVTWGGRPYNSSSAVVKLNRPEGIAEMALFSKDLMRGRRVGNGTTASRARQRGTG